MRLGTCLLFEGRTPQGAPIKLADFCSAPVAGFYTAVDTFKYCNMATSTKYGLSTQNDDTGRCFSGRTVAEGAKR